MSGSRRPPAARAPTTPRGCSTSNRPFPPAPSVRPGEPAGRRPRWPGRTARSPRPFLLSAAPARPGPPARAPASPGWRGGPATFHPAAAPAPLRQGGEIGLHRREARPEQVGASRGTGRRTRRRPSPDRGERSSPLDEGAGFRDGGQEIAQALGLRAEPALASSQPKPNMARATSGVIQGWLRKREAHAAPTRNARATASHRFMNISVASDCRTRMWIAEPDGAGRTSTTASGRLLLKGNRTMRRTLKRKPCAVPS